MDALALLQELVLAPGPPGKEEAVRAVLQREVEAVGLAAQTDPKGNLIVRLGASGPVVTAHMDEIALEVSALLPDGRAKVVPLGGIFPWKLGEGPVTFLADGGPVQGVLGFGSVHTESDASPAKRAKNGVLEWNAATVITGLTSAELQARGVRLGTRVVVSPSRRPLTHLGPLVAGHFLDDRADLVAWLLALAIANEQGLSAVFVATVSEEVGGEGAQYFLAAERPEVCVALELAPLVPDSPIELDARPAVWVRDGYSSMPPHLGSLVASTSLEVQWQSLSRGGSDASCAAARGLCAHPLTLGIPMENSHGYEVIHEESMRSLADLTAAVLQRLQRH